MHEHVFTAIIANDEAEALLGVEELNDTSCSADVDPGAHIPRGAGTTKTTAAASASASTAAAETATAASAAATAETTTAAATTAAAAEAITAAAAKSITTAAAETIAATKAVPTAEAAFQLVEPALTLVGNTTPGTTPAFIKAHFVSRSFMFIKVLVPVGGDAVKCYASIPKLLRESP
jgi:hypothetical protein